MNQLSIYQVDAFTDEVFSGNPAAVCILENWLSDEMMQKIAAENNLAETAFVVKDEAKFLIRWFTPDVEVDLCGHATLASAFVLQRFFYPNQTLFLFYSHRSGSLPVAYKNGIFTLDFPSDVLEEITIPSLLTEIFNNKAKQCFKGKTDYLLIFDNEEDILAAKPNFNDLAKVDCRGVIISSKGNQVDFVSRFFGPAVGVNEDPVTGSAHTTLTPYWAKVIGKNILTARQVSARGGNLTVEFINDRVKISGRGILYLKGEIYF
jgi:PhzF family phenazine biosynthesis protein